ncbi:serine/threonine-protein kinase KIN2, partial [Gonapodya sp. JEL0774]
MILGRKYQGPEVDMWSLGVILFALLCGHLPFDDDDMKQLYKKIAAGNYKCPDYLMPDARHLISRLITVDPASRATLSEVLAHRWVNDGYPHAPPNYVPSRPIIRVEQLDTDLVGRLSHFGYTEEMVREAFGGVDGTGAQGQENAITSTYFLLGEMLGREQRKQREAEQRRAMARRREQMQQQRLRVDTDKTLSNEREGVMVVTQVSPSPVTPATFADYPSHALPPTPTTPSSAAVVSNIRHRSFSVAQQPLDPPTVAETERSGTNGGARVGSRVVTQPAHFSARRAEFGSEPAFGSVSGRPAAEREQTQQLVMTGGRAESQQLLASRTAGVYTGEESRVHPQRPQSAFGNLTSQSYSETARDEAAIRPPTPAAVMTPSQIPISTTTQRRRATISPSKASTSSATTLTGSLTSIPDWFVSVSATSSLPLGNLVDEVARALEASGMRYGVAMIGGDANQVVGQKQGDVVEAVFECEVAEEGKPSVQAAGRTGSERMDVDGATFKTKSVESSAMSIVTASPISGSTADNLEATSGSPNAAASLPQLSFQISIVRLAKQPGQLGLHFKRMQG